MKCPNCGAHIPTQQEICPACYFSAATPRTDQPPANVLILLSSSDLNGVFSSRVQSYLQPHLVGWSFFADEDEAFEQITGSAQVEWHLVITDAARKRISAHALDRFRAHHSEARIAVLYRSTEEALGTGDDAVLLRAPSDIDDWLRMMYALLQRTSTKATANQEA